MSSYRDGKEIKAADGERVSIVRTRAERGCYELVIADVCADDAGTYTCNAINIYGDCVTEAKVTVVGESYKQKTDLYNYPLKANPRQVLVNKLCQIVRAWFSPLMENIYDFTDV